MADIPDTTQNDSPIPVPPMPEPPPSTDAPKKKKINPVLVITGLLLLLITIPLIVFYSSQRQQVTELRSKAAGSAKCNTLCTKVPVANFQGCLSECTLLETGQKTCPQTCGALPSAAQPSCNQFCPIIFPLANTTPTPTPNPSFSAKCNNLCGRMPGTYIQPCLNECSLLETGQKTCTQSCGALPAAVQSTCNQYCPGIFPQVNATPTPTPQAAGKPTASTSCSGITPSATISWTGGTPASYGYIVNLFKAPWTGNYYNKTVGDVHTTDSNGFTGTPDSPLIKGQTLVLQPGTTYIANIWNEMHSPDSDVFTAPSCAVPTPTPTPVPPTATPTPIPTPIQQIVYVNPTSAPAQQIVYVTPTAAPTPKTPVSGGPTVLGASVIGVGMLILILGLAL